MIEYEDVDERKLRLEELKNVEDLIWMQVEGFDKVYPIADEDMDRENETKTSSVHFVRFQLSQEMIAAAKMVQISSQDVTTKPSRLSLFQFRPILLTACAAILDEELKDFRKRDLLVPFLLPAI